jgi:SAM-dependent methyltransferase
MLHPLAEQFAAVAQEYERGRPDYPPAVPGALAAELGLSPTARVLDLGAGTGKLSRAIHDAGIDLLALEPQAPLREILTGHLGADRVIEGTAEAIPLPDGSIDAVTVADAFHWFDREPALAEIARVLRPGGGLALLSTAPDWGEQSWAHDLGQLVMRRRTPHPFFDGTPFQQTLATTPGWSAPREIEVRATQPTSRERMLDHLRSMSWVAAMDDTEREAFLDEARAILGDQVPAELPVRFFMWLSVRG